MRLGERGCSRSCAWKGLTNNENHGDKRVCWPVCSWLPVLRCCFVYPSNSADSLGPFPSSAFLFLMLLARSPFRSCSFLSASFIRFIYGQWTRSDAAPCGSFLRARRGAPCLLPTPLFTSPVCITLLTTTQTLVIGCHSPDVVLSGAGREERDTRVVPFISSSQHLFKNI